MKHQFLLLFSVLALVACDKEPPAKAEAPGPPPEIVKFPANAAHATFQFYDGAGQLQTVRERDDVPASARGFVAVTVGEKTPVVEDKLYVIDEAESDDRVAVARLTDASAVREQGTAAWNGSDLAFEVWEETVVQAGGQPPPRPDRPVRAPAAEPDKPGIIVEGITDGRPTRSGRSPKSGASSARSKGEWKSVVMYWGFPCQYCIRAKNWMRDNGVKYREVNIEHNDAAREKFLSLVRRNSGQREKYPTFVIGGSSFMQGWNESEFKRKAKR